MINKISKKDAELLNDFSEEFNLSNEIDTVRLYPIENGKDEFVIKTKNIKEFIRLIEKEIVKMYFGKLIGLKARKTIIKLIDKLAGDAFK